MVIFARRTIRALMSRCLAIEGFGQKIPLHDKLTDLGVKFLDLGVAVGLNRRPFVIEHLGQLLDRLAFLRRNLGGVQFALDRQLRNRPLALDCLQRNLGLDSAVNHLLVPLVDHPLRQ